MLSGLSELGQAYLSILNVYSLTYGLSGALLGIIVGCLPGLSATLCIALLTTLTIKMAPNDAILILICSYVGTLYGIAHRDPAQHSRHRGERRLLRRRTRPRPARRSRPRHRDCDIGRVQRHAVRRVVSRGIYAAARRSLAVVRGV